MTVLFAMHQFVQLGEMSLAEIIHTTSELAFVLFLVYAAALMRRNARNIARQHTTLAELLTQGQVDRRAREKAILDLQATAAALAVRTQAAVETRDRGMQDLSFKLDANTEMTKKAADASAEAAEVANSVNEKIADTNKRLLEQVQQVHQASGSVHEKAIPEVHKHIDEAIEIGKETLDKTIIVEQKLDELKNKET